MLNWRPERSAFGCAYNAAAVVLRTGGTQETARERAHEAAIAWAEGCGLDGALALSSADYALERVLAELEPSQVQVRG